MTATERLKQHLEDIEQRKITMFFNMQNAATSVSSRVYNYYIMISFSSLSVILVGQLTQNKDYFLISWSSILAIISLLLALIQYLFILDNVSEKLYVNICSIYKQYDDEFYILKKFNFGEIDEALIKQFYINKSKELQRYECHITRPHWIIWANITLLLGAIILLILA